MTTPQQRDFNSMLEAAKTLGMRYKNRGVPQSHSSPPATVAPMVSWQEFLTRFEWRQSQHIGLIGPTDSGKSSLAAQILDLRQYITGFFTKPIDDTLNTLVKHLDLKLMQQWKDYDPDLIPRRALWPDATDMNSSATQKKEFMKALAHIYRQGGWCVYFDELWYMAQHLGMTHQIKTYFQQVRSLNVSVVAGTQRPAFVPLELYNQSTHLFFWRDNDEVNLKRISGTNFRGGREIQYLVANLEQYQVLYVHARKGTMLRTTPPNPETLRRV